MNDQIEKHGTGVSLEREIVEDLRDLAYKWEVAADQDLALHGPRDRAAATRRADARELKHLAERIVAKIKGRVDYARRKRIREEALA